MTSKKPQKKSKKTSQEDPGKDTVFSKPSDNTVLRPAPQCGAGSKKKLSDTSNKRSRGGEGELPDYISVSQINTFTRCPLQYQYAYVDKIKSPPAFALDLGSSVHTAIEEDYTYKKETGENLQINDVVDVYSSVLRDRGEIAKENLSGQDYEAYKNQEKYQALIGANALRLYHEQVAINTMPLMIEEEFELDVGGQKPLFGIIDLVDSNHVLADTKTSGRRYQQSDADASLQLSTYAAALNERDDVNVMGIRFDVLVKNKTPVLQQITTHRTTDDLENAKQMVKAATEEIQFNYDRGYFRPQPSSQICGWCGYNKICPVGKAFIKKKK